MQQSPRWLLAGLLLGSLCAAPLPAAEGEEDPTPAEVRARVDQLLSSVVDGDVAALDEVTCLRDLLHAQLRREEALGLVADAADPALVAEREDAARTAVVAFVDRLLDEGDELAAVDTSRLELFDGGGEEAERLVDASGDEVEITASGVVAVRMMGVEAEVDLGVYRLADRWCLDPLSMQ